MTRFMWDQKLTDYYMNDKRSADSADIAAECNLCRILSKLFGEDRF